MGEYAEKQLVDLLKGWIERYDVQPFEQITEVVGMEAVPVFQELAGLQDLVCRFGIEPFVAIARAVGPETSAVLEYAVSPRMGEFKSRGDLLNKDLLITGLQNGYRSIGHVDPDDDPVGQGMKENISHAIAALRKSNLGGGDVAPDD